MVCVDVMTLIACSLVSWLREIKAKPCDSMTNMDHLNIGSLYFFLSDCTFNGLVNRQKLFQSFWLHVNFWV